jgi:acyl carrier protein
MNAGVNEMTTDPTILDRVTCILADYTDRIVLPHSNLITDLDLDSLETAELTIQLEGEFGIPQLDYDAEHMQTVSDLVNIISEHVATPNA